MLATLILMSTAALAGGPSTEVYLDGECPGDMDMTIYTTPGATVSVFYSADRGELVYPWGDCAGTVTGLGGTPGFALNIPDVDGDGVIVLTPYVPAGACGQFLQVLDQDSCEWSNVETIGDDEDYYYDYYDYYAPDVDDYYPEYGDLYYIFYGFGDGLGGGGVDPYIDAYYPYYGDDYAYGYDYGFIDVYGDD